MKITLAFAFDGEAAWLISAYDEYTADEHGGVPEFHSKEVAKIKAPEVVKEFVVDVNYRTIEDAFLNVPDLGAAEITPVESDR